MKLRKMRNNMISKAVKSTAILFTASIALTATACTVKVEDKGDTVGRLINAAVAEEDDEATSSVEYLEETSSKEVTNTRKNVVEDGRTSEKKHDVEANETERVVLDDQDRTPITIEPTTPSKPVDKIRETEATKVTEETKATEAIVEETKATEKAVEETKPTEKVVEETQVKEDKFAALKADKKKNYAKAFDFDKEGLGTWYLDCELGSFLLAPGEKEVLISYNNETFNLPITYCDELGVVLANSYLIDRNGTKYIWICNTVGADMHDTNVYKIGDNDITLVGVAESVSFPVIRTTEVMDGFECGGMGIMRASREYKVGDDGMPLPLDDIRRFDTSVTYKLAFWKELEGNVIKNGKITDETVVIPYNTFVTMIETDGNTYIDVEDADGNLIRVDISDTYAYHYKYFVNDIFYEGIMELVLDWKEPWL